MKYIIIGMINVVLSLIMFKINSVGIIIIPILMLGVALWLFESSKEENKDKNISDMLLRILIVGIELILFNTLMMFVVMILKHLELVGLILMIPFMYLWEFLIFKILGINCKFKYVVIGMIMSILIFGIAVIEYLSMYYLNGGIAKKIIDTRVVYLATYATLLPIGYILLFRMGRGEKIVNNKNKLLLFIILLIVLPIVSVIIESMNKPMGEVVNISTCGDLNNINKNGRYKLVKDIDCQNQKVNTIGFFSGEIDGNGKKISNVVVNNKLIERMNNQGSIENIEFNNINISGNVNTGIVGTNYGKISKVKVSDSEIKGENGVGVVGSNYSSEVEEIGLENSKISGINEVGGLVGINEKDGKVENISIGEKSEVSGYSKVGSVTGVNKGQIDHTFSSGNIVDKSKEQAEDYMGMINGQQVAGAWTQRTVYNGKYAPMSENIFSGMSKEIIAKDKASKTCVKEEYNKNKKMTRGEYTKLVGQSGKCEQYQLTNGERRKNYLAEDDDNGYKVNDVELKVNEYYRGLQDNELMNFDEEKSKLSRKNLLYKFLPSSLVVEREENSNDFSIHIWWITQGYWIWNNKESIVGNYSNPQIKGSIQEGLLNGTLYNFDGAEIWNLDVYPPQLKL